MLTCISEQKNSSRFRMVFVILMIISVLSEAVAIDREVEDFFSDTPAAAPEKERTILFYRNPMNPAITSSIPAKDEMGMEYIPVYDDEGADTSRGGVEGLAPVVLTRQGIELSGVITTPAVRTDFTKTIRTVGRVVVDETRIYRVQTRVSGWVETLHVNFTGQAVTKGEPLLALYSPDLVSGQEELISALETRKKTASSGTSLVETARKRLALFDVPEKFITTLEQTRTIQRAITLEAPATGIVTAKDVFAGQKVAPGMALLTITDFSRVWVEADFYEYEAGELRTGQAVDISSPYDSSLLLTGTVTYIYPYLNTESRTLRARIELTNESMQLKPGMFVDVRLNVALGESVVVPDSAVMYSGSRNIVFVNTPDGRFEPREVVTGARSGGRVQILSGIFENDAVAIKANFLLDSESRLQSIIRDAVKGAAHD